MLTSSCKAKGRRACADVRDLLLKYAPDLKPDDILVTSSSVTGEDLKFSPAARAKYPLVIEVKNQEKLSIWAALAQAESHMSGRGEYEYVVPTLFFKRNKSKLYVCLEAEEFIRLVS